MRKTIARFLARLALKIDPECEEALKFYEKQLTDQMIMGHSIVRVDPTSFFEDPPTTKQSD